MNGGREKGGKGKGRERGKKGKREKKECKKKYCFINFKLSGHIAKY